VPKKYREILTLIVLLSPGTTPGDNNPAIQAFTLLVVP
jgi:hypothetical protein